MNPAINAYLTFNGNCSEAMHFYKQCLGGELTMQTVGESPMADRMPQQMKDCILHATLTNDSLVIMGSDLVGNEGLIRGNSLSLMLHSKSEAEQNHRFKTLSEGGIAGHPIEHTFWGAYLGDFTDKFGIKWILHFDPNASVDVETKQ